MGINETKKSKISGCESNNGGMIIKRFVGVVEKNKHEENAEQ